MNLGPTKRKHLIHGTFHSQLATVETVVRQFTEKNVELIPAMSNDPQKINTQRKSKSLILIDTLLGIVSSWVSSHT